MHFLRELHGDDVGDLSELRWRAGAASSSREGAAGVAVNEPQGAAISKSPGDCPNRL
jgi:hypothetical protein